MQTAWRRRSTWAVSASIIAHLGVLTVVLLQHPTLAVPVEAGGPPEAIIPLLILPRTPPAFAGHGARPAPIRVHRRAQRNLPGEIPAAPVVVPAIKPAEAAPAVQAPVTTKAPAPPPAPPPDAVRSVLRATLGCADTGMLGLTREERAGCADRLGRNAHDAPYLAAPLSPEKRALLDQAGAAKMARKLVAERPLPAALPETGKAEPQDYSGEPDVATNAIGAPSHPPSKRAAKVLGRLPP